MKSNDTKTSREIVHDQLTKALELKPDAVVMMCSYGDRVAFFQTTNSLQQFSFLVGSINTQLNKALAKNMEPEGDE